MESSVGEMLNMSNYTEKEVFIKKLSKLLSLCLVLICLFNTVCLANASEAEDRMALLTLQNIDVGVSNDGERNPQRISTPVCFGD